MQRGISIWIFVHAIVMSIATAIAVGNRAIFPMLVAVSLSIAALVIGLQREWRRIAPFGGAANQVTLARFILLVCTLIFREQIGTTAFLVAIVGVMLADGLDGYLARRLNAATAFGEVFDTEVDAFLALALSFVLWIAHPEAVWLMAAGLLRYLFGILYRLVGWHRKKRPAMPETKVFAVIFFIALLIPWVLDWQVARWFAGAGCALVAYSFFRESWLLAHVREHPPK